MNLRSSIKQTFQLGSVRSLIMIVLICIATNSVNAEVTPKLNIQNLFTASGWMGDGEYGRKYILFNEAFNTESHSPPSCIKIKYTFGPKRWGGIYWQNKPDNWGDKPGSDNSKKGFKKIVFWAKGETGFEIVEFKAGGISNQSKKYQDSFEKTLGRISLSKNWNQYTIDLRSSDLSSVIGGFCWVASADYNSLPSITFYIDDIFFE